MKIPEKPENVQWTDDQWQAIHAAGSDILVAAAAGSGKTAVLVSRIIRKLINEKEPLNVDELLVVTFTNAAAAEMRHRIGEALEEEIRKNPSSRHLRRQLNLLNHAQISTLHSFCLDVVRKYYYLTDLDPGFRIAEETEMDLLFDEAADQLLEEEYGKTDNTDFFRVVDLFTGDRSDDLLRELILKLYEFSRANPDPEGWLERIPEAYEAEGKTIEELPYTRFLLDYLAFRLQEAKRMFEEGLELCKRPDGPYWRADNFIDDIRLTNNLLDGARRSYKALYEEMQKLNFKPLAPARGVTCAPELDKETKSLREAGKKLVQGMKEEYFSVRPETYLKDLQELKGPVETLIHLVRNFSRKVIEIKKEKGIVDFSDLEHYALQILGKWDPESHQFLPTDVAHSYRRRFKEILIDEYQDTNMVQETILRLVKRGEETDGNLFMVGDVKQSIYRFRLAEPHLFLQKYRHFSKDGKTGLRIDLAKNFRSRKEILDGTNFLFRQIMDPVVGEIAYDGDAELKKGSNYPGDDGSYPIEFTLLYKGDRGSQEPASGTAENPEGGMPDDFGFEDLELSQLEARYIAGQIRKMVETGQPVYDGKTGRYRPIRYRDITILFRSFTWSSTFLEQFQELGIPVYAETTTGYFDAPEVSTVIALLQIIDNPYQDIPLAAVLRSPIYGLTEGELARIRLADRKATFYGALKAYLRKADEKAEDRHLRETVIRFIRQLSAWRALARSGPLSDLIWQIYRDTKFYDFVGGLPGGKQRQANLRALFDRARQYEETSFRGLFRFLRFIEKIRDRGGDMGVARALGEQEDVVRMMTIHASKGLEFPVVFVAGLNRSFNMTDLNRNFLFDKDYGLAVKYTNIEKRITYPSLIQMAVRRKKQLEQISEEMRVLYVALTRAKEKLILVASAKDAEKKIGAWKKHGSNTNWLLANFDRLEAKSYLDWIGPALVRHRDAEALRKGWERSDRKVPEEIWNHPSRFEIRLIGEAELQSMESSVDGAWRNALEKVRRGEPVPFRSEYFERIRNQLEWRYPWEAATFHRGKQTVTEIKREWEIRDANSGEEVIRFSRRPIAARPNFLRQEDVTPTEKGSAMHLVMQQIDLGTAPTGQSIQSLIDGLVARGMMTEQEARAIQIGPILSFFASEPGKRLLSARWVRRELPFSFAMEAKEIYPDWQGPEEKVFVQGIIDCLFRDEKGLVLLDYKTDEISGRFSGGFEAAKTILFNRYRVQILLYRRAVEAILKEPVKEAYLYFFDGGHLLPVGGAELPAAGH